MNLRYLNNFNEAPNVCHRKWKFHVSLRNNFTNNVPLLEPHHDLNQSVSLQELETFLKYKKPSIFLLTVTIGTIGIFPTTQYFTSVTNVTTMADQLA